MCKTEPSEDAKRILSQPPERIYLQVGDDESEFPGEIHWRSVTWCEDPVENNDLVYVRSDLVRPAVVEGLIETLRELGATAFSNVDRDKAREALRVWEQSQ